MDKYMEADRFKEVIRIAREKGTVGASLLQRRLRIGYAVAAKYVDLMEETHLCSPLMGTRPRRINLKDINDNDAVGLMLQQWEKEVQ